MAKVDKYNFDDAEVDYRTGSLSVNAIAAKHGIPEPTLRREAKKRGWVKGLSSTKRAMVSAALAGADLTNVLSNDEVRQNQLTAAQQDVADMNLGLSLARKVLISLNVIVENAKEPRDYKIIMDAGKGAVDTIRSIRSLDEPEAPAEDSLASILAAVNGTSLPIVK